MLLIRRRQSPDLLNLSVLCGALLLQRIPKRLNGGLELIDFTCSGRLYSLRVALPPGALILKRGAQRLNRILENTKIAKTGLGRLFVDQNSPLPAHTAVN